MPHLWVARECAVLVVALACMAVLAWVNGPVHAAGSGLIFVSNEKSNTISVLDGSIYNLKKTIATSKRPRAMRFSADRKTIYVACGDSDVIDVIDVATLVVTGRIKTGESPEAFDLDRRRNGVGIGLLGLLDRRLCARRLGLRLLLDLVFKKLLARLREELGCGPLLYIEVVLDVAVLQHEGFADIDFWGSNNIIEPDKSIQNAIEKIQKKLVD